jgi:hypothetical protein
LLDEDGLCEWGKTNCQNMHKQCGLCFSENFHYRPIPVKGQSQRKQQADKRMGGKFEYQNHQNNAALLGASSNMTPNSGATGSKKGDEQISGIIEVMEELKTRVIKQAPGKESFTIKKEWLTKLNREAQAEHKEFWYLKFSFGVHDTDIYVITEQDIIMSMVKTMVEDRKKAKMADSIVAVAEKRRQKTEADLIAALAEIDLLKAQLNLAQLEKENKA